MTDDQPAPDRAIEGAIEPAAGAAQPKDETDIKSKMREALDRKHAAQHSGEAHLQGRTSARGVHSKEGGRQEFRRKAGS